MDTVKISFRLPKIIINFKAFKKFKKKYRVVFRNSAYIIQYLSFFSWTDLKINFVIDEDIINGFTLKKINFYEFKTLNKAKEFLAVLRESKTIKYKKIKIRFAVSQSRTVTKIIYYLYKYHYFNKDVETNVYYTKFTTLDLAKSEIDKIKSGDSDYKTNVVYKD